MLRMLTLLINLKKVLVMEKIQSKKIRPADEINQEIRFTFDQIANLIKQRANSGPGPISKKISELIRQQKIKLEKLKKEIKKHEQN